MKLIIARADELDVDLIVGQPNYSVWKGPLYIVGGNGKEGEEVRTIDPITELDLDSPDLMDLIEHGLLDAETCQAFYAEEGQVCLNYIHAGWDIPFINFHETIFRDPEGLPCYLNLFLDPRTNLWKKSLYYI